MEQAFPGTGAEDELRKLQRNANGVQTFHKKNDFYDSC